MSLYKECKMLSCWVILEYVQYIYIHGYVIQERVILKTKLNFPCVDESVKNQKPDPAD